jgi:acyl-CoA synthetase (AMP-forming)/AMP-acid ligase II
VTFAASRSGVAVTPIDPSLTTAEAGHRLVDSAARVLVRDGTAVEVGGVAVIDPKGVPIRP